MHEFGHNLGLGHGGLLTNLMGVVTAPDHVNYKPNHFSIMNYTWQTAGLRRRTEHNLFGFVFYTYDAGYLDYSRFGTADLPTLSEAALNETNGISAGAAVATYATRYYCQGGGSQDVLGVVQTFDWNCDGDTADGDVSRDVNQSGAADNSFSSANEWVNLVYSGGAVGDLGVIFLPQVTSTENMIEPTIADYDALVIDAGCIAVMPNLLSNPAFTDSEDCWQEYGPINFSVANDLAQIFNDGSQAGIGAVMEQQTFATLPAAMPLQLTFKLGNSSANRQRVTVIARNDGYNDLVFCTFWLDAGQAAASYTMNVRSLIAWHNPWVSIFASTANGGAAITVDDVSIQVVSNATVNGNDCIDPNAPPVGTGADSTTMVVNGDFSAPIGAPDNWKTFGNLVSDNATGVFQMYSTANNPVGVVLQDTPVAVPIDTTLEATFQLRNSHPSLPLRLTVLLHARDFSDLQACSFVIPPNFALQSYTVRAHTTLAWDAASISFYASTVSDAGFVQLDNVTYTQRPSLASFGTTCYPPGTLIPAPPSAPSVVLPVVSAPYIPPGSFAEPSSPAEMPLIVAPAPIENTIGEGTVSE